MGEAAQVGGKGRLVFSPGPAGVVQQPAVALLHHGGERVGRVGEAARRRGKEFVAQLQHRRPILRPHRQAPAGQISQRPRRVDGRPLGNVAGWLKAPVMAATSSALTSAGHHAARSPQHSWYSTRPKLNTSAAGVRRLRVPTVR